MNVNYSTKPRLGRGLDALLGPATETAGPANRVPINSVHENPYQPRKAFDTDELAKLRDSIREFGVLQPVVVRADSDGYQLIAGEPPLAGRTRSRPDRNPRVGRGLHGPASQ